ncbi:hypothetical protein AM588_10000291 [Phytophthora nicotianae]|uniref:Uncharacterized protein n=1 Tax=Phytophthora nicotianae TaxID=4792 RepID=A0A0W8CCD6_PHYNI|nr:hypothetical protein AM588_10000291 [Phytophthora nicotianae]
MFLAALARPRYDPHRKQQWDDKLGVWSFTEKYEAQRSSKNRAKGAVCTRNIDTVDREVYREYLVTKVFPAIKAQWPRKDRHMLILVQQDNAKPHVEPWDRTSSKLVKREAGASECYAKHPIRPISTPRSGRFQRHADPPVLHPQERN